MQSMGRVVFVVLMSLFAITLSGCGKSEEEKRFHKELLDKALNDEVRKAGDRYLAENARREGVTVTSSGMQYEIIVPASGAKASMSDSVQVNYTGWLTDGTVIEDTSDHEEKPFMPLNKVLKGWREALMNMSPGARWRIYLPPELAYGARSPSELIPANSSLIFEIELLRIVPEEQATKK